MRESLPADPDRILAWLHDQATAGYAVATISRRLSTIRQVHRQQGHPSPTDTPAIKTAWHAARCRLGTAPRKVAPATIETLRRMVATCDRAPAGRRDHALLLVGFAGALRRSEMARLAVADVETHPGGIIITIRRPKGDQHGAGQRLGSDCRTAPARAPAPSGNCAHGDSSPTSTAGHCSVPLTGTATSWTGACQDGPSPRSSNAARWPPASTPRALLRPLVARRVRDLGRGRRGRRGHRDRHRSSDPPSLHDRPARLHPRGRSVSHQRRHDHRLVSASPRFRNSRFSEPRTMESPTNHPRARAHRGRSPTELRVRTQARERHPPVSPAGPNRRNSIVASGSQGRSIGITSDATLL